MNRQDALRYMQALHAERISIVATLFEPNEYPVDTGSARAERVDGRPIPIGDEDFDGFIVVTNVQMIYHDRFGSICMPWNGIARLVKHKMRGLAMTTGMEIVFDNGSSWVFSGNTPFIKQLVKACK